MSVGPVAIIDIGSNSIKVLVAGRSRAGLVTALHTRTLDARIGGGISQVEPRLTEESMERGLEAIRQLIAGAQAFSPKKFVLVATSAVRDAQNGEEFRGRVHSATGHDIRILTGQEEANLIGRGLTCDPALVTLEDFYVFDLGGGSLECLAFRNRTMEQALSLQLGCVRLTEKLVADITQPVPAVILTEIQNHTRTHLAGTKFAFDLPRGTTAVGTGGTITTVRTMLAARHAQRLEETDSRVELVHFRAFLAELSALPLAERKRVAGLPPTRADVFPTALATLITLAELGGFDAFQHSFYNLRYGLAAEALDGVECA